MTFFFFVYTSAIATNTAQNDENKWCEVYKKKKEVLSLLLVSHSPCSSISPNSKPLKGV